jgi:hypothetical protein
MKRFVITETEKNKIRNMYNLMNEDESSSLQQFNSILQKIGLSLSPEEIDELKEGCILDISQLTPEEQKQAKQYEQQAENMTEDQVINKLVELNNEGSLDEQLTPQQTNIARGAVGLFVVYLLIRLAKGIFGGRGNKSCRKINKRYKRWGIRGVTESINERMEKPSLSVTLKKHIDEASDSIKSISDRHIKSHSKKQEIKSLVKDIILKHKELKKLLDQGEVNLD